MILAFGFVALGVVVVVCVLAIRRFSRSVEEEEADRILRAEYDKYSQNIGES